MWELNEIFCGVLGYDIKFYGLDLVLSKGQGNNEESERGCEG